MGFDTGTLSFRRFAVIGSASTEADQAMLDQLSAHTINAENLGVPEEIEFGFSGGRHVLDDIFSFDRNIFVDTLHAAMRIDTNKVPSALAKAFRLIEEDATAKENPSGFISKRQKKIAKETAQRRLDDELRTGKYRRSKIVPLLWDLPATMLYCPASSKTFEVLAALLNKSFGLDLELLGAGNLALRQLEARGKRRDYEDATPTRFVKGPEGDSQRPEYPWTAKGDASKDFLGNEFLLWLWHQAFIHEGAVRTEVGELTVFLEQVLDLDCAYGITGRDSLRGDGVTRMPEAIDALRSGKVPRRIGLILEHAGSQFSFKLAAESLAISGLKLPDVEEAENPRALFEERIGSLRDFTKAFDSLFWTFLNARTSSGWEGHVSAISKWIAQMSRSVTVSA